MALAIAAPPYFPGAGAISSTLTYIPKRILRPRESGWLFPSCFTPLFSPVFNQKLRGGAVSKYQKPKENFYFSLCFCTSPK